MTCSTEGMTGEAVGDVSKRLTGVGGRLDGLLRGGVAREGESAGGWGAGNRLDDLLPWWRGDAASMG